MNLRLKYILYFLLSMVFYYLGHGSFFVQGNEVMFVVISITSFTLHYYIKLSKDGGEIYLRPIAGMKAIEESIGRATEMGKPVLFVPGISDLDRDETV